MAKYINPFVDYGFKYIFGREESKPFLIDFLNSLLCDEPGFSTIVDIEYLDKERSRPDKWTRGIIYDIHCKASNGKRFVVEMQNQSQEFFFDRVIYYSTKGIVDQGVPGREWGFQYLPVYCVSFMNFVHEDYPNRLRIDVGLCDLKTKKLFSDKQRFIFIQTPLFDKKSPEECVTNFDRWMYNIINMPTMDTMAFVTHNELFDKFEKMASYAALSPEDRMVYDANVKAYRDLRGQLEYSKKEGRKEGIKEGKIEMVHNLAKQGISLDIIAAAAEMSLDEINSILN